jgi:hypothetical protein
MQHPSKTRSIAVTLLIFGAGFAPAWAEMAPMAPSAPGAPMPGGMGMGMMGMPTPAAGMPGMPPAAATSPATMGDDKMAMPPVPPAPGTAGMPQGAAPTGMAGGKMPMMEMMMGQMAKMQPALPAPLDHVEGRIAYMRAELAVTDVQAPAWDRFAAALRTSRAHLDEARTALVASNDARTAMPARLEAYAHHLSMRFDSLRAALDSFKVLYPSLTAAQQVTADELAGPLLASF